MSFEELESTYTSGLYTKRNITMVRGCGAHLWDSDGHEYIDCVAGQGSANLGHGNPAIAQALFEQANTLITCPEIFHNDTRARYLEKLVSVAPAGIRRVFLCNSGTEAVEAALKFARVVTGRAGVVAAVRGFHGRTIGALSATWEKKYREPFEPLLPNYTHVAYNDVAALEAAITDQTGAVLLEVVQGEGGVRPGTAEFLHTAQRLCRERGAMLVVDEVQTGFGRTGRIFASQHFDLQPDLLAMAKSMAGGLPMGAVLMGERIGQLPAQIHGSTFGGNPLACAAGLAALNYLQEHHLPERAAELGAWFMQELRGIPSPLIREVRGLGLMVGIELKQKAAPYLQALMEHRVLAIPAGMNVMRFLPPLVVTQDDLTRVVAAVRAVLPA